MSKQELGNLVGIKKLKLGGGVFDEGAAKMIAEWIRKQ